MSLEKIPRWALVLIASIGMGLMGVVANNVYADSQKTKQVAYQAKNAGETAQLQVAALSGQLQDIKNSNDVFRKEYRDDQKELRELILRPR